jgi:protein-disulfide isomerase
MSEATITLAVPVNERDHVMERTNAPVTVVNYGDYECPGSQNRHRAIEKMARELLSKVRLVHRHFPLVKTHPRGCVRPRRRKPPQLKASSGRCIAYFISVLTN